MAPRVFRDAKVWLAQYQITSYLNELEITHGAELVDNTVFGKTTRSKMAGLETLAFSLKGFLDFNDDAQDEIMRTRVGTQDIPLTLGIETGLVNTRAYLLQAGISAYDKGGAVGILAPFTLAGQASGGRKIVNGIIVEDGMTARTATGAGTAYQLGYITIPLTLTAAANAAGGLTVYTGTIASGTANAYAGRYFTVAGFDTAANNGGPWLCTASSSTTLTLSNAVGVAETHAGTASMPGKLYAVLHLVALSGFTSIDVVVASDSTEAFPSPVTRVTFANLTVPGAEYGTPATASGADFWWRAEWTLNGAGPGSATIIVATGIK